MTEHVPATVETVRHLALALPGVKEGTSYGTPALRGRGRFLARLHDDQARRRVGVRSLQGARVPSPSGRSSMEQPVRHGYLG